MGRNTYVQPAACYIISHALSIFLGIAKAEARTLGGVRGWLEAHKLFLVLNYCCSR